MHRTYISYVASELVVIYDRRFADPHHHKHTTRASKLELVTQSVGAVLRNFYTHKQKVGVDHFSPVHTEQYNTKLGTHKHQWNRIHKIPVQAVE